MIPSPFFPPRTPCPRFRKPRPKKPKTQKIDLAFTTATRLVLDLLLNPGFPFLFLFLFSPKRHIPFEKSARCGQPGFPKRTCQLSSQWIVSSPTSVPGLRVRYHERTSFREIFRSRTGFLSGSSDPFSFFSSLSMASGDVMTRPPHEPQSRFPLGTSRFKSGSHFPPNFPSAVSLWEIREGCKYKKQKWTSRSTPLLRIAANGFGASPSHNFFLLLQPRGGNPPSLNHKGNAKGGVHFQFFFGINSSSPVSSPPGGALPSETGMTSSSCGLKRRLA